MLLKPLHSRCWEDHPLVSSQHPIIALFLDCFDFRSIVIRYLDTSFSNNQNDIAIIFAYCRYMDRYSVTDILASFIKQLAERHPNVLPFIENVYQYHLKDATRPIEQEWLELLQTLIPLFSKVYIIIDALDEFPDDTRDEFLNALISLQTSLLITSRPSNAFSLLSDIEYIHIGDENEEDIERFIHQRFRESSNLTSLLRKKDQILKEICTKLKEISKSMYVPNVNHSFFFQVLIMMR